MSEPNDSQKHLSSDVPMYDTEKSKCIKYFLPNYLTLISIIQSAATGYFGFVLADHNIFSSGIPGILSTPLSNVTLVLTTLLLIIAVWQEYLFNSIFFHWFPGISDSLIPFFIGVTEFLVVSQMGKVLMGNSELKNWYFCMLLVCLCGVAAFWNFHSKAKKLPELNRGSEEALKSWFLYMTWPACLGLVIIFVVLYLFTSISKELGNAIAFCAFIGWFARAFFYARRLTNHDKKNLFKPKGSCE